MQVASGWCWLVFARYGFTRSFTSPYVIYVCMLVLDAWESRLFWFTKDANICCKNGTSKLGGLPSYGFILHSLGVLQCYVRRSMNGINIITKCNKVTHKKAMIFRSQRNKCSYTPPFLFPLCSWNLFHVGVFVGISANVGQTTFHDNGWSSLLAGAFDKILGEYYSRFHSQETQEL